MEANILLVEDENDVRQLLRRILVLEGFTCYEAASCKAAWRQLETQPIDVILCDVKLPDGNGVEFIQKIKSTFPAREVIVLTAYGNIPDSVQAIKNGAYDYITKVDDNARILPLLYRALEKVRMERRIHELEEQAASRYAGFDAIVGQSKLITDAKKIALMAAPTDATILLLGETGTGKEIFAQAIHTASKRRTKNFLAINCSSFSRELIESELFGHKAGAFTGATREKKGLMEEADHGTLFLDEIGEMPLELQAKLLRLLETGEYYKLGDTRCYKVDVRIIAATNRDLTKEVREGRFREDLLYRLNLVTLSLPPLRSRQQDIPLLAEHFLARMTRTAYPNVTGMTEAFLGRLLKYDWRGNIRELKNVIERSLIVCTGQRLTVEDLPVEFLYPGTGPWNEYSMELAAVECMHIQKVLRYTGGNKTQAARLLKIGLATLYRKIQEYQIDDPAAGSNGNTGSGGSTGATGDS